MLPFFSQAWRSWKSARPAALLAVVALAVGVGSATAIFTVIDTVLVKPLPYRHGERFVALFGANVHEPTKMSSSTWPDLQQYKQRSQSFDVFGWFRMKNLNMTSPGEPQHLEVVEVTPELASNLGISPAMGQWFRDDTKAPSAVISHALWKRLGANEGILGKPITLSGKSYSVVGVMPPWFRLPIAGPYGNAHTQVWLPLDPSGRGQARDRGEYFSYARLKPGVTFAQAESDVKRIATEIAKQDPVGYRAYTARLDNLQALLALELRPTLLVLLAAAGLLLLITCANVSGLMLVRFVSRARETAVRVALGARTRQLALQYLFECLLVCLPGAAAGIVLSIVLVRIVVSMATNYIPRSDEISVDWRVLTFALAAGCLASVLSSLAPLWQAARTPPNEALNDGTRSSAGSRSRRLSQAFVIGEVALAFTLVAASSILLAELQRLRRVSPGFDPNGLLTFGLALGESPATTHTKPAVHQAQLIQALEAIPGVTGAAFVNQLPLAGCCYVTTVYPDGRAPDLSERGQVSFLPVSSNYIRTMRIPLLRGRFITDQDTNEQILAAVVNKRAADMYWPHDEAVGKYGHFNQPNGDRFQVVGVVGDVRNDGLANVPLPEVYLPALVVTVNPMKFAVRSTLPPNTLVPEIRKAIHNVDPLQPIDDVKPMTAIALESLALKRLASFMMTSFGLAALLMATLGVYSVVSYSVRQRTVEVGTRMALGAVSGDLVWLVVGGGLKMAAYGIAIGGVAVAASTWFLLRQFEIRELDSLPFVFSTLVVVSIAAVASLFPAWRATLVSPLVAIRNEPGSMWRSAKLGFKRALRTVSRAVSGSETERDLSETDLLDGFIDAARRAENPTEALELAVIMISTSLGARSAVLLANAAPGEDYRPVATVAGDGSPGALSLPAKGYLLNRVRFVNLPLPITAGDFETWLHWSAEHRPQYLAEIQRLREAGTHLVVVVRAKAEIQGILLLGPPADRETYGAGARRLLARCAEQFALLMENARLTGRVVEQEKLRRDIALATEVQRRLLPQHLPELSGATLAAVSIPARSVGGDYYDFLEIGDNRLGIAIADVAGKGVAAALIMSVVHAALRIISSEGDISLPQLATKMNQFLHRSTRSSSYATFFYAQVDQNSRRLRYVNAGHNPPYLHRRGEIQELPAGGTVLGLFPKMSYEEAAIDLEPGDVLIVFTDGVTEALNPEEEEFGEDRLKDLLRRTATLPVQEISAAVSEALRSWIRDAAQYDDLTFIVMKVN